MIALKIVPVELADPAAAAKRKDGAGVLVPDAGASWMEYGEENAGWYTVHAATWWMMLSSGFQMHAMGRSMLPECVVKDDSEVVAAVGYIRGQLVALIVQHFSAPTDSTDFFEDAPMPQITTSTGEALIL